MGVNGIKNSSLHDRKLSMQWVAALFEADYQKIREGISNTNALDVGSSVLMNAPRTSNSRTQRDETLHERTENEEATTPTKLEERHGTENAERKRRICFERLNA